MKIIIAGAGIACVSAIKAIRHQDKEIPITVYGEESHYPYKRIRLTKDLASGIKEENLLIEKQPWYEINQVNLYTNKKMVSIDPSNHRVFLSDGTIDEYTALLLANGASNYVLPINGIDKDNVFTLRNLWDTRVILEQAAKSKYVLVIGGGILGLEMAWSLTKLGKKVTVVESLPRLMPRQLDENASTILQKIVESYGVEVHIDSQVKEITGDGEVTGFITDQNLRQPCDMIIHSTGICPNIHLVKGTDIQTNRGIIVNERMETNLPRIYAAGDVAEFQRMVPGLWNVASLQGKIAGSNIAGLKQTYEIPALATVMNAFNYSMFAIGESAGTDADYFLTDKPGENKYRKIVFREGKITEAIFMGSIKELPSLKRAMEGKTKFPEVYEKEMHLSDFLLLVKEKQAKKEMQLVSASSFAK